MNRHSRLYNSLMLIEFVERFITFSVKLTMLSYITNIQYGLGYALSYGTIAYGCMEFFFYSCISLYSLLDMTTHTSMLTGATCMLLGILGICYTKHIIIVVLCASIMVGGKGFIKTSSMHIISHLYSNQDIRIKKLANYYAIINIGSCLGGIVGNVMSSIIGWNKTYKYVLILYTCTFLYILYNYFYIKNYDVKHIQQSTTIKTTKITNDNYISAYTVLHKYYKQIMLLTLIMCIGAINVSFSCSIIPVYLCHIGQHTINLAQQNIPVSIIVQFNPIIIAMISQYKKINKTNNIIAIRFGLIISMIGYLTYLLIFISEYKILVSIAVIIILAISEIFLMLFPYNIIINYFQSCKPRTIAHIISITYLSIGIASILITIITNKIMAINKFLHYFYITILILSIFIYTTNTILLTKKQRC